MVKKNKKVLKINLLEIFIISTVIAELFLIFIGPHITHNSSFDSALLKHTKLFYKINPVLQTLWTSEIISLLVTGICAIVGRRHHKLGTVYAPNVAAFMGFYGLYFGFYYTNPSGFNDLTQTALPNLLIANLWLIGFLFAGWLLGKGLECAGKPGFWIRAGK